MPPTKSQPDGVLGKALARAWRWQKLLDRGIYTSLTEVAKAKTISKSCVSRILWLALLAPDPVEAMLGGWIDQELLQKRLEQPLPIGWQEQRAALRKGQPRDSKGGRSGSPHLLARRRGLAGGLREIRPRGRALRQTPNVT